MRLLISGATKSMERFAAEPLYREHIGHLWTPATGNDLTRQARTQLPWACDNAAFGHQWDAERFQKAVLFKVHNCPIRPLFVPVPDVVGDSRATLDLFFIWLPIMKAAGLLPALVLQDGSENQLLPWQLFDTVFVGGSRRYASGVWGKGPYSEWKE